MFIHNFKYALKTLFNNKMLIFWTFAFPIILGTFFNMAFADLENSEQFDAIDIAIVDNDGFESNYIYKEAFRTLSDEDNSDRVFNIRYVTSNEAEKLLADNEISGYLIFGDTVKVVVRESGINQTILKYVTEEIMQTEKIIENVAGNKIQSEANIKDISVSNLSYIMIEFYTLIAMTCLYGGILGMVSVNRNLANMSSNGRRTAVSPVSKAKLIFGSALAGYITQLIGVAILFVYTIFVLKVDYGSHLLCVIVLTMAGCLAGLTLGIAVATLFKTNDNVKTGVIISVTMVGCFLSGMMGVTLKYVIDKNVPILNKLNPAAMITDGFYSLYYYDTFERFWFNVLSLCAFACVMLCVSVYSLRRQQYDSI